MFWQRAETWKLNHFPRVIAPRAAEIQHLFSQRKEKTMQIETSFAAAIANAGNYAAVARKHGFAQTPADQVFCAMVELKEAGRAEGISDDEVYAIVDRYVIYDANGEPQPRPMGNVVPFRGR